MAVTKTDPPEWDRPNPKAPTGPNPVVCDRCGALVSEWQTHSDWHATLASSDAVIVAALVRASGTRRSDLTPEVRRTVDWANDVAQANA